MEERIFTLAEAESLLPQLRTLLQEIIQQWDRIRELNPDVQKARDNAAFDGTAAPSVKKVYPDSFGCLEL